MNLREYLVSIGRMPQEAEHQLLRTENEQNKHVLGLEENRNGERTSQPLKTIGDIFDYYKALGHKSLPANVQINAINFTWQGLY